MKFNFSKTSQAKFYTNYLLSRLFIPLDVKNGRANVIATEVIWVSSKIFKFKPFLLGKKNYYETKFGKFNIHPDLISTVAVSPSFERLEMDMLLEMIGNDLKRKKKVLFVDVGAFFGLYSIAVGNRFKKNKNLRILAFEPGTSYLSEPTADIFKRNIKENKLERKIKNFRMGLGEKNAKKSNKAGVITKKLDSLVSEKFAKSFDSVYMKIDVDGYEKGVLLGGKNFIRKANSLTILIEDFVDTRIVKFLEKDFDFLSKPSVYNSFWKRK